MSILTIKLKNVAALIMAVAFGLSACSKVTPQYVTASPLASEPASEVTKTIPIPAATSTKIFRTSTMMATSQSTNLAPIVIEQPTQEFTLQVDQSLLNKKFPLSLIQIEKPGNNSQVASPIAIQANVYPGEGGMISVQLIGENGRLMADQLLKMTHTESGWVQLVTEIKFEITSAGESGLIVVSTRDGYGRWIAQAAVPVLLMQFGKSTYELPDFLKQPFVIESPVNGGLVKNGILKVSGYAHPFNSNPIIIELMTQTGGVLESKVITLPKIAKGQEYASFTAEIPYQVTGRTPVRLTVRQRSESLPAIDIALSSQIIYLDP